MASQAGVFWLESDPASGLNLIHTLAESGEGSVPLLPDTLGVRSQVNGYGGGALCAAPDRLFAIESSSQQIYDIMPETGIVSAVTDDASACFGGLVWDRHRERLLAVREDADGQQLVAIRQGKLETLHQGEDFYSAPAVSDSGRQLAWISWHLPDMPWVSSVLWLARVDDDGMLVDARPVMPFQSPTRACVQQPVFVGETLYVLSDHLGWWQPWQMDENRSWRCLDDTQADQASAPWQLGECQHLPLPEGGWLRVRYLSGIGGLWWQPDRDALPQQLGTSYVDFRCLTRQGDRAYCIARSSDRLDAVLSVDMETGQIHVLAGGEKPFDEVVLSSPEPFRLPESEETAFVVSGFYYPPVRSQSGQTDNAPLVMIAHGGPTAMICPVLNPQVQFLCHQGFAVAEVNYRGSSGFGRDFRLCLAGQWGVLDVQDIECAARHLVSEGKASAQAAFMQGRSSGGYTALMALVSSAYFTAGVSQFGVSDPERLRAMTHRFESGYLDWLLGSFEEVPDRWRERSPLMQADRIQQPMAFFQGGQDAIVVPEQTHRMATAIRANGRESFVQVYPDEGHGFRKASNQADMLTQLAVFYRQCLQR
ncbi:prolyl oligopeptidase family serine peptidase [Marinobacter sp. chi1]|uniref:Prolyl oligopeptidase family serine peptidase n=1 Tax=Marinobacter suaedae TaxID=3057675 RepID=A0ABT8W0C1_9GAMM|nr:prolyl oligopeptidase family serine peptidase [Marinobacter sp. chi1]MDO3721665.1 prolyl oligopeptidase family serine peptidase [Marinobacter sp. chi1]